MADPATRAIGICAVGGTGKTALIGQWLRETSGWSTRPFVGLFAWSFYANRTVQEFLAGMLAWAHDSLGATNPPGGSEVLPKAAVALLRSYPLIVVLDGLETLQEGNNATGLGRFLELDLQQLLTTMCRREHASVAVLTSRFMFADLQQFAGLGYCQLDLSGISPEGGADLLQSRDVFGTREEREEISRTLEGHALGLRIFADAIPDNAREQPLDTLRSGFEFKAMAEGAPLVDKLQRLLGFYEKKVTLVQSRLLQVVGLFRVAVTREAILRIYQRLFGEPGNVRADPVALSKELDLLVRGFVLSVDPAGGEAAYSCHPVLRDHFRALLFQREPATRISLTLLAEHDPLQRPTAPGDIEPVLLAIEALLEGGDFSAARNLYQSRLDNGRLFFALPAPVPGLQCALQFIREERRAHCERALSIMVVGSFLNDAALCASAAGQFELAERLWGECGRITLPLHTRNRSRSLQNQVELLIDLGRLGEAERVLAESEIAAAPPEVRNALSHRSRLLAMRGEVKNATDAEFLAGLLPESMFGSDEFLIGRTLWFVELQLRSGLLHSIPQTLDSIRTHSGGGGDLQKVWWALWLEGWHALADGRPRDAARFLREAEEAFTRSQSILYLARVNVTAGEAALVVGDLGEAADRAEAALALALRGMRLIQADALVLRGKVRLRKGMMLRSLDDGESALRIAGECGYRWAERDAHALLAEVHSTMGAESNSLKHREMAAIFSWGLTLTLEDLIAARDKAKEMAKQLGAGGRAW